MLPKYRHTPASKMLGFGREMLLADDSRGPKARANGRPEGDMTVDTSKML